VLRSLFGKEKGPSQVAETSAPAASTPDSTLLHVGDDTFEDLVIHASLPILVDFWAPWCGPCRMIAPIVEELAKAYRGRVQIAKVNTDENSRVASELGIAGIPTLVLFKAGREVERVVGYVPRHVLEEKLNAVLS
jgi:thioredoxin 1